MIVKLLYFGEGVTIPHTTIGMGVSFVSVWIDGAGYTSASNDVGATGYVFLNTQQVDIGEPDAETAAAFAGLHGSVVNFEITPNLFVRNGGIARIKLSVLRQQGGAVSPATIEFVADNCTGVSAVSNTVTFSVEMLQMERQVAEVDESITEDDMVAMVDAAPDTSVA